MRLAVLALLALACTAPPAEATRPPTAGEPTLPPPTAARTASPSPRPTFWVKAPIEGDPSPILAKIPATGIALEPDRVRLLPPRLAEGPRRVALQVGHWRASEAPREFPNLPRSVGGSFREFQEVDIAMDIAGRTRDLLQGRGLVVDVLPATVPPSYIADVFVSLHADVDVTSTARGFKVAHGTYRSPHDAKLEALLTEHYAAATGLPWDPHVTDDMTDYYAFAWFRYEHALAPHTPAAIVELGFISHPRDREVLIERGDAAARGLTEAILRFLDAHPRSLLFGQDIAVQRAPAPTASPGATASP
jgi:hypothetical protein